MKVPGQHEEFYSALLVLCIKKWHRNGIHRWLVPADGSCCVPYAAIGFRVSHMMGDFPSQRAALNFVFLTCCSVGLVDTVGRFISN